MDINIINALQARFGSADFTKYQVIRAQKYDFVRYPAAGTTTLSFFSNPIGSQDPNGTNKTLEQTNLVKSASFGQEFFAVTQLRTWFGLLPKARQAAAGLSGGTSIIYQGYTSLANSTMQRFNDLAHRGVLEIKLAQKLYWQIQQPLMTCPAGFGLHVNQIGAAKLTAAVRKDNFWVRPNPNASNIFVVDPVQIIEPEIQIEAALQFPDGTSPVFTNTAAGDDNTTQATPSVEIGLILDGYTIRPSQ